MNNFEQLCGLDVRGPPQHTASFFYSSVFGLDSRCAFVCKKKEMPCSNVDENFAVSLAIIRYL